MINFATNARINALIRAFVASNSFKCLVDSKSNQDASPTKFVREPLLLKDNDKQNIILERFDNAVSKNTNKYNSFIDLVGILETICVGNDKDELSFRFSLYVSYLLNNKLYPD
ncbi:MAG: hypothetical protein NW226_14595 [Microscillaceae bacterium]|nr:hypothetical protein [Microscillaceae bacterium]